ncbi:hypothetical protein PGT21_007073 [Puccinia graminis f. sp. tritici]|uniref:Uncharacterized protein n=1 Tax=Puccinia graminis f. sp. tritici TaxID=56615 RepID=A0A5B0RCQ8_PUCGR|nr:hypothetical protein PGT21_007073 [Puccinia graminis f. sp. tritici]KAA1122863.1 hypothetical protein PGTUg99_004075 [Puccinia graminis f. sp. tritici]
MVSLAYLITLLSLLVAVSRAEEVAAGKTEDVDPKYWGYGRRYGSFYNSFGNCYSWGCGWTSGLMLNSWGVPWINSVFNNYNCYGGGWLLRGPGMYFVKATEEAHSVARRALPVSAEQLVRREAAVTCISNKGVSSTFSPSECIKAAHELAEKKTSSATHGSCTLTLVTKNDKVAPSQSSSQILEKAVNSLLGACGKTSETQSQNKNARRAAAAGQEDDTRVALLLSKPN